MYFVWTWNAMAYRRGIAKISKCSCSQNTLPFAQWRLGVPSCFRNSETQSWCTSEIIGLPHHPSLSKHHAAYAWSLLHCNAWHVWLSYSPAQITSLAHVTQAPITHEVDKQRTWDILTWSQLTSGLMKHRIRLHRTTPGPLRHWTSYKCFTYNYDISTYSVKVSLHLLNRLKFGGCSDTVVLRCGPVRCIAEPLTSTLILTWGLKLLRTIVSRTEVALYRSSQFEI